MSVNPQLMQQMLQRRGAGQAAAAPGQASPAPQPGATPPAAAPLSQPQEKKGLKVGARANLTIAQKILGQALLEFTAQDTEYKAILKALNALSSAVGQAADDGADLVPAEVMQMVKSMPQAGGGTDMQRMIAQQMAQGRQPQQQQAPPMRPMQ